MKTKQQAPEPVSTAKRVELYNTLAFDIWAQHAQLRRFEENCTDREIRRIIGLAREALAVAGSVADAKALRTPAKT